MEDLIRDVKLLKEEVITALVVYHCRKRIIDDAGRDTASDKLHTAICALVDFVSLVEPTLKVRGFPCTHCGQADTVAQEVGQRYRTCSWCGQCTDGRNGAVIVQGDLSKAPLEPVTKCSNCQNSNTVGLRKGEPDVVECSWCRWAFGRTSQVVLNDGDPSKKT